MEKDNKKIQDDLVNQVREIRDEAKKANNDFMKKTDAIIKDIDDGLAKEDKDFEKTERKLEKIMNEGAEKMDALVVDFISKSDEMKEEEAAV